MSSKSLEDAYAAGSQAASSGDDGVCSHLDGDEYRAFKDGYYHTLGQIDASNDTYRGFSLSNWFGENTESDEANLEAYNKGATAELRGKKGWFW